MSGSAIGMAAGYALGGPVGGAIGGALGGALDGQSAAEDAAQMQSDAARAAAAQSAQTAARNLAFNKQMYEDAVNRGSPYLQAGQDALARLRTGIGAGGEFNKAFSFDQNQDPSYQWRFNQGQRALEAGAAARGGLFSAGQQQALQNYGQNAASQEYQNAFNRWQGERDKQFEMTRMGVNAGQQAMNTITGYGNDLARNNANISTASTTEQNGLNTGAAAAQAAGRIGAANQMSNFTNQIGGALLGGQIGGGFGGLLNMGGGSSTPFSSYQAPSASMYAGSGVTAPSDFSGYNPYTGFDPLKYAGASQPNYFGSLLGGK